MSESEVDVKDGAETGIETPSSEGFSPVSKDVDVETTKEEVPVVPAPKETQVSPQVETDSKIAGTPDENKGVPPTDTKTTATTTATTPVAGTGSNAKPVMVGALVVAFIIGLFYFMKRK